jgi:hypothetical protein
MSGAFGRSGERVLHLARHGAGEAVEHIGAVERNGEYALRHSRKDELVGHLTKIPGVHAARLHRSS